MTKQIDLKAALKQLNMTQEEMAQHLAVRPETLHRWVCGRAKMPAHLVARVVELYNSVDTKSAIV